MTSRFCSIGVIRRDVQCEQCGNRYQSSTSKKEEKRTQELLSIKSRIPSYYKFCRQLKSTESYSLAAIQLFLPPRNARLLPTSSTEDEHFYETHMARYNYYLYPETVIFRARRRSRHNTWFGKRKEYLKITGAAWEKELARDSEPIEEITTNSLDKRKNPRRVQYVQIIEPPSTTFLCSRRSYTPLGPVALVAFFIFARTGCHAKMSGVCDAIGTDAPGII